MVYTNLPSKQFPSEGTVQLDVCGKGRVNVVFLRFFPPPLFFSGKTICEVFSPKQKEKNNEIENLLISFA